MCTVNGLSGHAASTASAEHNMIIKHLYVNIYVNIYVNLPRFGPQRSLQKSNPPANDSHSLALMTIKSEALVKSISERSQQIRRTSRKSKRRFCIHLLPHANEESIRSDTALTFQRKVIQYMYSTSIDS